MTAIIDSLRVLRHAAAFAITELGAIYSWQSWLFGWVGRVIMQVIFYALIGVLLEDPGAVQFLLIGNIALIAASMGTFAVQSTQWERYAGTFPLLVAAPSRVVWVYLGRSVEWFVDGLATSVIALAVVAPIFDIPITLAEGLRIVPLLLVIIVATYGLGTFLGALVMRNPDARNVVMNLNTGVMAIVTGANVPVEFFPEVVQVFAQVFPLTHGLEAVRAVVGGAGLGEVGGEVGLTLLVGLAWATLAAITFERFAESGRRDGSIDFAD
jgi:ABC-2 type transport system permease protein